METPQVSVQFVKLSIQAIDPALYNKSFFNRNFPTRRCKHTLAGFSDED